IQTTMENRNADKSGTRALTLRIGINLGDVIVEGEDVFGDGVNVAARLEGVATPGAIAISATVRDHIGSRLDLDYQDLGDRLLKNIERPVRIYTVRLGSRSVPAGSQLPLPDVPSVAVLPFENMSGDADQESFTDGLTEDII